MQRIGNSAVHIHRKDFCILFSIMTRNLPFTVKFVVPIVRILFYIKIRRLTSDILPV